MTLSSLRCIVPVLLLAGCLQASAQADKAAERAARRAQLQAQQLQSLQQELQAAQAAKAKVEADKSEVEKRLQSETGGVARVRAALRQAEAARKTLEGERAELAARLTALEAQVVSRQRATEESLAAKDKELAAAVRTRDLARAQLQSEYDAQVALLGECSDKNQRLVALGSELLDRWQNKGFRAVLSQKEPLLGFGDVQMFNLVQDYRDRSDAQRFSPASAPPGR